MNRSPLTYDEYQSAQYFPALDGLRALSCLLIVAFHAQFLNWGLLQGHAGVPSFFVLSGYLITTLALREEAKHGSISLKAFYVRRTFRILPAYYAVLALYCAIFYGLNVGAIAEKRPLFDLALPYYLTYMNEYSLLPAEQQFGVTAPFAQSWSLGVEEKFYLVWPFLAFSLLHKNPSVRFALAAALVLGYYLFLQDEWAVNLFRLPDYTCILIGCLLAILMEQRKYYLMLTRLATPSLHVAIAMVLVVVLLLQKYQQRDFFHHVFPYVIAFFIIGLVAGRTPIARFFSSGPLAYLGTRSYGIYLLHNLAMEGVELVLKPAPVVTLWKSPFYFLACVAAAVFAAEVLYRFLEKPLMKIGRRISARIEERGGRFLVGEARTAEPT